MAKPIREVQVVVEVFGGPTEYTGNIKLGWDDQLGNLRFTWANNASGYTVAIANKDLPLVTLEVDPNNPSNMVEQVSAYSEVQRLVSNLVLYLISVGVGKIKPEGKIERKPISLAGKTGHSLTAAIRTEEDARNALATLFPSQIAGG